MCVCVCCVCVCVCGVCGVCVCVCQVTDSQGKDSRNCRGSGPLPQNTGKCVTAVSVAPQAFETQILHARANCAHYAVLLCLVLNVIRGEIIVIYSVNKVLPSVRFTQKDLL